MKLLLAEDDVMLGTSMEKGLALAGFQVDWVSMGNQAIEALSTHRYDVVLLDIGLPQVDGLQILRWMRKEGQHTPVMMVTARDAVPDRVAGLNLGADDYLTKPFDLDELCARTPHPHGRGFFVPKAKITFQPGPREVGVVANAASAILTRCDGEQRNLRPPLD